jgi:hypothetical protein
LISITYLLAPWCSPVILPAAGLQSGRHQLSRLAGGKRMSS